MKKNFKRLGISLLAASTLYNCSTTQVADSELRDVADSEGRARSAYDVWGDLQLSSTDFAARGVLVGEQGLGAFPTGITFGAEKEASSALITRIMTPKSEVLRLFVGGLLPEDRKTFIKNFFTEYLKNSNGYRTFLHEGQKIDLARDVKDVEGVVKVIDLEQFKNIDFDNASIEVLTQQWEKWLSMTEDRPLSFLKPSIRMKMFKGQLPGMSGRKGFGIRYADNEWTQVFGPAQKYINDIHAHGGGSGGGWEIGFKVQNTYGEFEEMVAWFRKDLKNAGKLFQAPGHQRMVYKIHDDLPREKLSELYKIIQAYIVTRGILGKTGIESASYKSVHADSYISMGRTGRGVIRLEGSRWLEGSGAVEFRAGTKDIKVSRFVQTTLASRIAANDFDGIADISTWSLIDSSVFTPQSLVSRFGVTREVAEKALSRARSSLNINFMVPFYNWTDANSPFISGSKAKIIKGLTKDLIEEIAELSSDDVDTIKPQIKAMTRSWISASRIDDEMKKYIAPKRSVTEAGKLLDFGPATRAAAANPNKVDVNKIDLGIEYSGRLPLKLQAETTERMADNKRAWIRTFYDHTPAERESVIKNVAQSLYENLGGEGEPPVKMNSDGHGHGLDVSYSIRDKDNRKWIVEWDGIGRSYDAQGNIIEGSARSGSIELVTPKFTPKVEEMDAVYKAFDSNNILPHLLTGGGHINIDLAAFEGNPKALGRFMSIFHEHRGIMAMLFQHVNRLHTSEGIDISANLTNQLKNFTGSEDDLKKLLYNKQYFNTRFGRKSRYLQLDMSAYFQDVIPEEFVTDDFDISNPTVPWRRQFRVDPRIRKAEFRMFNAPRDSAESALQIRLVKALLHKALNEDGELDGAVQKVDHEFYANNPGKALADLEKLCTELGLNIEDYRPSLGEALSETQLALQSRFYRPLAEKMNINPPQKGWGQALSVPRSADKALSSEGRSWSAGTADELNTMTNEHRLRAAQEGDRLRSQIVPNRHVPGTFKRSESCLNLLESIL